MTLMLSQRQAFGGRYGKGQIAGKKNVVETPLNPLGLLCAFQQHPGFDSAKAAFLTAFGEPGGFEQ
ncbi:hypothetical protein [Pseudomonas sp.]|uniref:hypothetical protein n=1 Tax=Pseudomonas sp. TaxID=306 RepID=UPI00272C7DD0|nr:hypothetical protein [Pseudomonas sp.]